MKKNLIRVLCCVFMALMLCACGKKSLNDAGKYYISGIVSDGEEYGSDMLKMIGFDSYYLDLREDGTFTLHALQDLEGKWEDGKLSPKGSLSSTYTIENGVITIATDENNIMYFTKEGMEVASNDASEDVDTDEETTSEDVEEVEEDTRTPIQKWWDGDWYGIMYITSASGNYASFSNSYWDAMATLAVDENGVGNLVLWYDGLSRDNPVAEVTLDIQKNHGSGEMGAAFSENGWIFANSDTGNGDVKHADWIIDPMINKYENMMVIDGSFVEGAGTMDYSFWLRKWGDDWEDVKASGEDLYPIAYDDWYMPLVNEGYAMPNNILDEGTVKMDEKGKNTSSKTETADSSSDANDSQASDDNAPSNGDGIADKDTLCRAYMWTKAYTTEHWDTFFTYDAVCEFIGAKGIFNKDTSDETYDFYKWATEDGKIIMTAGFRTKNGAATKTMSSVTISGVSSSEYETYNPFEGRPAPVLDDKADITVNGTTFSVQMPKGRWFKTENAFGSYLAGAASESDAASASCKFQFVAGTNEEVFKDDSHYENIASTDSRTISGIEMKGRTFKYVGYEVTEYSGECNGKTVAIRLYKMTLYPNSEFEAILDSITIK